MNLQIVGTHLPVEPLKDKIWLKAQHLEGALGIFEMFQNSYKHKPLSYSATGTHTGRFKYHKLIQHFLFHDHPSHPCRQ